MAHSREFPALGFWLLLVIAAAAVGSIPSPASYTALPLPSWAPPPWLFGPVWSVLYLLMAIAAWLVWRERHDRAVGAALVMFVLQLALNALWTWIFFGFRRFGWALAEILVLLALIILTTVLFWRARPLAGALLLPYIAWVSFASALTWAIWRG